MTESQPTTVRRQKAGRSPSYPGIPLADAIDRAKTVYDREKRNAVPVSLMIKHWGYGNPKGGRASVTFAALKKFGLVVDEGSGIDRPARLTDLAWHIIHAPEEERREAVRKAALLPTIHRELWDKYGDDLPSDESLKWTLMNERAFTPSGAEEFIREFRSTIAYAGLTGADPETSDDDPEDDGDGSNDETDAKRRRTRSGGVSGSTMTIPVPIIGGKPVVVEGVFPITEAAWTQFMAVLQAMKPGLVADEGPDEPQED